MKFSAALVFSIAGAVAFFSKASAAIVFSGGVAGSPVVVTFTEDLVLPVTAASNSVSVSVLLKDAYASYPGVEYLNPQTAYGAPGSISLARVPDVGPTVEADQYNTFGSISAGYGEINPRDIILVFFFPESQAFAVGDELLIRAGSVTFNTAVPLPTNPISSVAGLDDFGNFLTVPASVPEPSCAALSAIAGGILWIRRRRN